jgi:hypothetical protein
LITILRNVFSIFFFISLVYYLRVRKIHLYTGEWHYNLFEYYEVNGSYGESLILLGAVVITAIMVKLYNK